MENRDANDLSPPITTSTSVWPINDLPNDLPDLSTTTLNSVFHSEPIANNCDFNNYLQSLGDHEDPLLNVDAVATINAILTPEKGKNTGETNRLQSNQDFDLGQRRLPSLISVAHGQSFSSALPSSRASQSVEGGITQAEEILPDVVLRDLQIMQDKKDTLEDSAIAKKDTIKDNLLKIKEQLDKSEKVIAPDPGPAVVTEFIDNSGVSFSEDLEDTSKCSIDSMENAISKEAEMSVRRSSRKTVRLFDIVGPRSRKSGGNSDVEKDAPRKLRSEDKEIEKKSPREAKRNATEEKLSASDDTPKRRSDRTKQKEIDKGNEKEEEKKQKKRGRPRKETEAEDGKVKLSQAVERDRRKGKDKSGDDNEQASIDNKSRIKKKEAKAEKLADKEPLKGKKKQRSVSPRKGKQTKNEEKDKKSKPRKNKKGGGKTKSETKDLKGKNTSRTEDSGSEDESSSDSDESVPDDGELSDDGSEFDPDEDPDRPWCICRKPHGNRFMICCDTCEDWFHGDCVGITQSDGKEMEKKGEEWMCPKCQKKLKAMAKEIKEQERLERLKNRWKSDEEKFSPEEKESDMVQKKLLHLLQRGRSDEKRPENSQSPIKHRRKKFYKDKDEFAGAEVAKKKARLSVEDKETREAKKKEEELEWKRQLKEMKARALKAEVEAKRRESLEGHITFEKLADQKITKFGKDHLDAVKVKQEPIDAKLKDSVKSELNKAPDVKGRRKSETDKEQKHVRFTTNRISDEMPQGKVLKRELSGNQDESPKQTNSMDNSTTKKVRITPTPKTLKPPNVQRYCIVCNRAAMKNAVYCSQECITSHTKESLRLIAEDKLKRIGVKSPDVKSPTLKEGSKGTMISPATSTTDNAEGGDGDERITVLERSSGKVLAGLMAPTKANIYAWVEEHPTFEVFRPATSSTTSLKEKKDLTEVIRNNVKKSLKETILARCREVEMDVNIDDVTKICQTIEEEIVKMFGDTGQKYKTKYRSLIFNLKDPKNRNLYKQVVLGDLAPSKLVHMSPEQLASAELARWREKEAKHNIELIKKREEEEAAMSKHAVKKTHKGEVELETEADDMRNLETHIESAEEQKETEPDEGASSGPIEDTTSQHNTHLFDLNCKICTGKQLPAGERQPILPHVATAVIQAVPESSMASPTDSPEDVDLKQSSPDVIASLNKSPIHIPLPSKDKVDSVWKGFVMMQSVAKFATCAFQVSGPCDKLLQLLPDTIHVCGRISHEQVWDYLFQIKSSNTKVIDVLRFEMASEAEKAGYVSLYSYFYTRKRIGVIGNCYSDVKDMYLVPLASHDPVPPELKPFEGPGMPDPRPHMLLGVIVRKKPSPLLQKRSKSSGQHSTPEPISKKSKKHSKKHHKKSLESPYEDIIFGKQKHPLIEGKNTPSESSSAYTPPDNTSPPSSTATPTADARKDSNEDAQLELEMKLEKQKQELLRLQAEIQAQMLETKSADTMQSGMLLTPANATTSVATTSGPGLQTETPMTDVQAKTPSVASLPSLTSAVATSSLPSDVPVTFNPQNVTSLQSSSSNAQAAFASQDLSTVSTALSASSSRLTETLGASTALTPHSKTEPMQGTTFPSQDTLLQSTIPQPITSFGQLPGINQAEDTVHLNLSTAASAPQVQTETINRVVAPAAEVIANPESKTIADADEPYDPEDAILMDIKEPETEVKKPDAKKATSGDEPYDPEDDFVLDLIEDISLPTALKKIDKPNLPFPLDLPKKQETKMPELPPIHLPEKRSDRRVASLTTSSTTLVDPRSNASPRYQTIASQGAVSSTNVDSPTLQGQGRLTSPATDNVSPAQKTDFDQRVNPAPILEGDTTAENTQGTEVAQTANRSQDYRGSTATDIRSSSYEKTSEYWGADRQYSQSYGRYDTHSDTRGQTQQRPSDSHDSYYNERYDNYPSSYQNTQQGQYQGHWQDGHSSLPRNRQSYDVTRSSYDRSTNNTDWGYRERGYDTWQRDYYQGQYPSNENDKYHGDYSHERANYDNYARDYGEHNRSWHDRRGSGGHYRGSSGNKDRDKQWK